MTDISVAAQEPLATTRNATAPSANRLGSVRSSASVYLLGILMFWSAELLLLIVLQLLGTGMGLRVRQTGEDIVWAYLFQFNSLVIIPREFWLINDRNPISPWWYMAAHPLIAANPYGIYLVRKAMDLACASAVFLLLDRLGHGRQRFFAIAVAVLTLLWNFSGYADQIMWNFLGALALSLVTLLIFCRYVDGGRRSPIQLALSLLVYLFAISTYTLQSSSIVGIFAIALFRGHNPAKSRRDWFARVRVAIVETSLFAAVFVVYTMIWYTAARETSDYYKLTPSLARSQFLSSVKLLFWHFDYSNLIQEVLDQWAMWQILLVGGIAFVGFGALFWVVARREHRPWGVAAAERSPRLLLHTVGLSLIVAASLAAATVVLEATSGIWVPGLRARMIQQVFQPLVYLGVLFGVLTLATKRAPSVARFVAIAGAAGLCAVATIGGLQYNRDLNRRTAIEEHFEAGLKAIVSAPVEQTRFIVRVDPKLWQNSDSLSDAYIQTFYGSKLVNMRVLQPGASVSKWEDYSTIIFGPDDSGIQMGKSGATAPEWVQYSNVRIVAFDGETVTLLPTISPSDMAGLRVGFQRSGPILQVADPCRYSMRLQDPLDGSGWSVLERTGAGAEFRWMASTSATTTLHSAAATLHNACDGPSTIQLHAVDRMAPDILASLSVLVDGQPVALVSKPDATGTLMSGRLTLAPGAEAPSGLTLTLAVPRTEVPSGGDRTLAVAFDRIEVVPAGAAAGTT